MDSRIAQNKINQFSSLKSDFDTYTRAVLGAKRNALMEATSYAAGDMVTSDIKKSQQFVNDQQVQNSVSLKGSNESWGTFKSRIVDKKFFPDPMDPSNGIAVVTIEILARQ